MLFFLHIAVSSVIMEKEQLNVYPMHVLLGRIIRHVIRRDKKLSWSSVKCEFYQQLCQLSYQKELIDEVIDEFLQEAKVKLGKKVSVYLELLHFIRNNVREFFRPIDVALKLFKKNVFLGKINHHVIRRDKKLSCQQLCQLFNQVIDELIDEFLQEAKVKLSKEVPVYDEFIHLIDDNVASKLFKKDNEEYFKLIENMNICEDMPSIRNRINDDLKKEIIGKVMKTKEDLMDSILKFNTWILYYTTGLGFYTEVQYLDSILQDLDSILQDLDSILQDLDSIFGFKIPKLGG